jgi:putative ABC transport system ATP-binding protein
MLCDEPTGALDSKTGILVLEALSWINRELGTTMAIITHNAVIREIADRVISFRDGAIVESVRNERRLDPSQVSW